METRIRRHTGSRSGKGKEGGDEKPSSPPSVFPFDRLSLDCEDFLFFKIRYLSVTPTGDRKGLQKDKIMNYLFAMT
ncbi:MAG: hypothetical protein D084_Lepto4C00192G0001 [Leptospirillum sp. Group IV 'UBA BS']|nr:MAG: hypothetical protein D084_Lepto4C00192G0001 [Leptospirillum sp. Group IV 'UBA BS']